MPVSYHDAILRLKRAHSELVWFEKLFFPAQLASELTRYSEQNQTTPNQFAVFKAFEKTRGFFKNGFLHVFSDLMKTTIQKPFIP